MTLDDPLLPYVLGVLLAAIVGFAAASVRLVARGLRLARPLDLIRGIRLLVLALVAGLGAVALVSETLGFAIVGALILAEELYETGVVAAIIRSGEPE